MSWCQPASCPGFTQSTLPTQVVVTITDLAGAPVPLLDPSSVQVDAPGGLVEVTSSRTRFKANLKVLATDPNGGGLQPAISMYNSYNHPAGGDPQTRMSVGAAFHYVSRAPVGTIGGDQPLNHQQATFTANATDPDGSAGDVLTYAWDLDNDGQFDDGTGQTAQQTFSPGTYPVLVQVTDPDGAVGTLTRTVTIVNQPPVAAFDCVPSAPQPGEQITCTSTSTDPDAGPNDPDLNLEWTFPGGTAEGDPLQVTLPAGNHDITLTATDRDAGQGSVTHGVVVADTITPTASLTLKKVAIGALLKKGLKGTMTVDEAATATLKATISSALAKKLKLKNPVAKGTATTPADGATGFSLTFTPAARSKLKTLQKFAVKVTATVKDPAGNTTTASATRTYQK
jgi:hypothetical protein